MHRILIESKLPPTGQLVAIDGDEAAHAIRVKRLEIGDMLMLLDGAGAIAEATIEGVTRAAQRKDGTILEARVGKRHEVQPARPMLEVFAATPKGGRVDEMIDQLSQIGAAAWGPLETVRGVVEPRERKLERLDRIAREAAKQAGRAWLMRIESSHPFVKALDTTTARVILADSSGEKYQRADHGGGTPLRLLIGPEGGWTAEELNSARARGVQITRFGPHIMRIETAAAAAASVIMAES